MLTRAEVEKILTKFYDQGQVSLASVLAPFTLTEKERNQTILDGNFLRAAKQERAPKKYSRKDKHRVPKGAWAEVFYEPEDLPWFEGFEEFSHYDGDYDQEWDDDDCDPWEEYDGDYDGRNEGWEFNDPYLYDRHHETFCPHCHGCI